MLGQYFGHSYMLYMIITGVFLKTMYLLTLLTPRNIFLEESNPAANIRAV